MLMNKALNQSLFRDLAVKNSNPARYLAGKQLSKAWK